MMVKIPSNRLDTTVEFRQGSDGNIQSREVIAQVQESSAPWRNLTRIEMLFYLTVVALWESGWKIYAARALFRHVKSVAR